MPGYPAMLADVMADRDHALRPSRAIVFGRPTLSRPVIGALLGADDVDVIVVDPGADGTDAARRAQLVVPAAAGRGAPAPARVVESLVGACQRGIRGAGYEVRQ